ncbi:hypothetical protein, partial [Mesorhizobium sp. M7A.T.Ca.TU.009.02.1.1]|uniref:hypothetical protein n=1 Tax=Mesorhizobium sp. M7A.T.Ca.TU.009.02.1.1 TaxID=2496791 RepID=UPI0019D00EF0
PKADTRAVDHQEREAVSRCAVSSVTGPPPSQGSATVQQTKKRGKAPLFTLSSKPNFKPEE